MCPGAGDTLLSSSSGQVKRTVSLPAAGVPTWCHHPCPLPDCPPAATTGSCRAPHQDYAKLALSRLPSLIQGTPKWDMSPLNPGRLGVLWRGLHPPAAPQGKGQSRVEGAAPHPSPECQPQGPATVSARSPEDLGHPSGSEDSWPWLAARWPVAGQAPSPTAGRARAARGDRDQIKDFPPIPGVRVIVPITPRAAPAGFGCKPRTCSWGCGCILRWWAALSDLSPPSDQGKATSIGRGHATAPRPQFPRNGGGAGVWAQGSVPPGTQCPRSSLPPRAGPALPWEHWDNGSVRAAVCPSVRAVTGPASPSPLPFRNLPFATGAGRGGGRIRPGGSAAGTGAGGAAGDSRRGPAEAMPGARGGAGRSGARCGAAPVQRGPGRSAVSGADPPAASRLGRERSRDGDGAARCAVRGLR